MHKNTRKAEVIGSSSSSDENVKRNDDDHVKKKVRRRIVDSSSSSSSKVTSSEEEKYVRKKKIKQADVDSDTDQDLGPQNKRKHGDDEDNGAGNMPESSSSCIVASCSLEPHPHNAETSEEDDDQPLENLNLVPPADIEYFNQLDNNPPPSPPDSSDNNSSDNNSSDNNISSDDDDGDNVPPAPPPPQLPVYEGSPYTAIDATVAFAQLSEKHNLSQRAVGDLLKYIHTMLPAENHLPSSLFKFKQSVPFLFEGYTEIKSPTERSSLFLFDAKRQLETILTDNWESVMQRREEFITAVGDDLTASMGSLYNNHFAEHMDKHILSLVLYIDAAPAFKKAKGSFYFILAQVLELPYNKLLSDYNTVVLGVFSGGENPDRDFMLNPVVENINALDNSNINVNGENRNFHVWVHSVLADLPAKAFVINQKQFNGRFGCSLCLHPGEKLDPNIPTLRIYRYREDVPQRTPELVAEHVAVALTLMGNHRSHFGIRGETPLSRVIQIPTQIPLDPMHAIEEGVFKRHLLIILAPANRNQPYSIRARMHIINSYMSQTKVPHEYHRTAANLSEDLKGLKATEHKLTLYHLLPTFIGQLEEPYLTHLFTLCMGVRILSLPKIETANIDRARELLNTYCSQIENYYGPQHCTYNTHALTHMADQVPVLGPLQSITGYTFESTIGIVKRHCHGSRNVTEQTAKSVVCNKNILKYKHQKVANNVFTLLNVTEPSFSRKKHYEIDNVNQCKVILPYTKLLITNELRQKLHLSNIVEDVDAWLGNATEVDMACRVIHKHEMIHSIAYSRKGNSCSFIVGWQYNIHKRYGSINYFFKFNNRIFADIKEFRTNYYHRVTANINTVGHFIAVENLEFRTRIIDCSNIISRCVYVPCTPQDGIIGYLSPIFSLQHD